MSSLACEPGTDGAVAAEFIDCSDPVPAFGIGAFIYFLPETFGQVFRVCVRLSHGLHFLLCLIFPTITQPDGGMKIS